ncbi:MAG: glycosyl hydrolase, partial [Eubacteriales bacterium]
NYGEEWFGGFIYTELKGLGYEEGIHRRDPSSILCVDGRYYVWYTKSVGPHFGDTKDRDDKIKKFPWDYADIWYASSEDGIIWKEEGCAVHRGGKGEYDERTICTPDCMEHEGKYYLVYQALPQGIYTGKNEKVAMAVAEDPNGPWIKTGADILQPMEPGNWFGDSLGNYNDGAYVGATHDPMLFYYNNQFYLYYKCGATKRGDLKSSGQDTRWGVAMSDNILGPYKHSEYNPITNSGHETLLWKYKDGIAALLNRDGPEKDTIQYAEDGINFEVMSSVYDTPMGAGAFRGDHNDNTPLEGIRWGICHYDERASRWNYLVRFDLDSRHPYAFPHTYPKSNCQGLGWFW